jgi:hypothetical protein
MPAVAVTVTVVAMAAVVVVVVSRIVSCVQRIVPMRYVGCVVGGHSSCSGGARDPLIFRCALTSILIKAGWEVGEAGKMGGVGGVRRLVEMEEEVDMGFPCVCIFVLMVTGRIRWYHRWWGRETRSTLYSFIYVI